MTQPRAQLHAMIAEKIDQKLRSERMDDYFDGSDYADAVMELFHSVQEEREHIDITGVGEPARRRLNQGWIVAKAPSDAFQEVRVQAAEERWEAPGREANPGAAQ